MWSRPHPKAATAPDPVGPPTGADLTTDAIWVVVLATADADVILSTGGASQTFQAKAGANKFSMPIAAGGKMRGTIQRGGQTVVKLSPQDFTFNGSPPSYNFNAFVAGST